MCGGRQIGINVFGSEEEETSWSDHGDDTNNTDSWPRWLLLPRDRPTRVGLSGSSGRRSGAAEDERRANKTKRVGEKVTTNKHTICS